MVNNTAGWNVNFTKIFSLDWSNITITESQVTDLSHVGNDGITLDILNITGVDDNVCGVGDFVKNVTFDNGDILIVCDTPAGGGDILNGSVGNSLGFAEINSTDWSNITITESQISNLVHTINGTNIDVLDVNASSATIHGNLDVTGNLTIGEKITFAFGEIIDNIVNGIIQITGNLLVTGEINTTKINSEDWTNVTLLSTQLTDGGTIGFDWVDAEIADTLTIGSSSTVDKGALANTGTLGFDWADSEVADTLSIIGGIFGANSVSGLFTTTGTWTLGDGGDRIDIDSNTWDVTNGVMSGVTTLDTGQGANELYDMNQNVLTTSAVVFDSVNITGELKMSNNITMNNNTICFDSACNAFQFYNGSTLIIKVN